LAALERQVAVARAHEARERAAGRRAIRARHDARSRRLVLELSNGVLIALPVASIDALRGLSARQLGRVALDPGGALLCWDAEDIHLSVAALIDAFAAPPGRRTPGVTRAAPTAPGATRVRARVAAARAATAPRAAR
jgi:hypothetical protein